MADVINIEIPPSQQYRGSFQELADARRVLKVTNKLRQAPVLRADDRLELERIRAHAIRCIEAATEHLIDLLDTVAGDADEEANGDELDGSSEEEDIPCSSGNGYLDGPGCPLSEPDHAVDDLGCDPEDYV